MNLVAGSDDAVSADCELVACLGSSSTAGKGQAFNWIADLARRPSNKHLCFRNFGVGGDLAYNALQRVHAVVDCRPQKIVVWVGANDVLAFVSPKVSRFFRITKRLPVQPSFDFFRMNLHAIVRRLRDETTANVGLCSLPPIGEDPNSQLPFQSSLNKAMYKYNTTIKDISSKENVSYIPLYEAMRDEMSVSPGRAFTSFHFLPFYRDAFRTLVLRKSPDEVARVNGWLFHSDGVHLNSRGGMIVANVIQEFLQRRQ